MKHIYIYKVIQTEWDEKNRIVRNLQLIHLAKTIFSETITVHCTGFIWQKRKFFELRNRCYRPLRESVLCFGMRQITFISKMSPSMQENFFFFLEYVKTSSFIVV